MSPLALSAVKMEGEFGRRVNLIIRENILKIDLDETFLKSFRERGEGGYLGLGKFIDACVRLSAGSGSPECLEVKKKVVDGLLATQEAGGYIGTVADTKMRVKALWDLHENAYIIWALVSDYLFFREERSLQAARRMTDYLLGLFAEDSTLAPDTMNGVVTYWATNLGFDRALLALSRATGDAKYRDFVVDFMKLDDFNPEIHCGPSSTANHAYMYMGHCLAQFDLYRETGDARLLQATRRAMNFLRRGDGLLVTGSCSEAECWHETQSGLQNTSETCMASYLARMLDSMLQLEGDSLYGDIMERDIYNALFAATAPDGSLSRYFTPFDGKRVYDPNGYRFCCANNNKRFLGDFRGWIYYQTPDGVAVNLYNASSATVNVATDVSVCIEQETEYPTFGAVRLKIDPSREAKFVVKLRVPRWCEKASVSVNGSPAETVSGGRFHAIERVWKPGDVVLLNMPMAWRLVRGRRAQAGRAAILRGPVIFTLNPERNPILAAQAGFEPRQIMIHPAEIGPAMPDESVRPGGQACEVKAWPPEPFNFWPFIERVPLVLSEFPDPGGEGIYFLVPDGADASLVDDELIELSPV